MTIEFKVGDLVYDDLTGKIVKLLEINVDKYNKIGYKVDSDWLEGLRHPWEITNPSDFDKIDWHKRKGVV